jgi:CRISPR-associated protein Cas1
MAGLHLDLAKGHLNPEFRLEIAKSLVGARIFNQRIQLMRLNRERDLGVVQEALADMKCHLHRAELAESTNEALGFEGASAARYWEALGCLVKPSGGALKRSRPATDPFNAAINYLIGILEREMRGAIERAGLLPGFGFLHGIRDRHDALVFDLMEPFRAPLTEGLAVFLFRSKRLRHEMFATSASGGVDISRDGRNALVEGYETAASRRVRVPDGSKRLGWRGMMLHQTRSLVTALREDDTSRFVPYRMRP